LTITAMPRSDASGKQPLLRLAVDDVVGELHEIDRLVPHYLFEKIMAAPFGSGDSNVAHRHQPRSS